MLGFLAWRTTMKQESPGFSHGECQDINGNSYQCDENCLSVAHCFEPDAEVFSYKVDRDHSVTIVKDDDGNLIITDVNGGKHFCDYEHYPELVSWFSFEDELPEEILLEETEEE